MAYRSYFRSVINDNFKILTWVLILFIAITPNFIFINTAYANTGLNGWTITDRAMEGATRVYNGAKNAVINGANVAKTSLARIQPTTDIVSKAITRTGAVLAVDLAIQSLIGGVDYVMDPANNRVLYTVPSDDPTSPTNEYYFVYSLYGVTKQVSTIEEACILAFKAGGWAGNNIPPIPDGYGCSLQGNSINAYGPGGSFGQIGYRVLNPNYDPEAQPNQKSIPYSAVADQVISDAETDPRAGGYVGEAIDAEVANGGAVAQDVANQFDTNAQTQTAEGANEATGSAEPNTANPEATDISLEFPAFCGWAPQVCEAANVVINFPNRLQNWWNTATSSISEAWTYFKNWLTETQSDTESTEVPIEQNTIIFDDSQRLTFSNSCPMPEQFNVSFFGASQDLEFSYQPLCDFMTMIKPFVIAGSYLIGAYIVMGLSRGSGD